MADYKIPCPNIIESPEVVDLWELFRKYIPDFLQIRTIIPHFKTSIECKCKWLIIVEDTKLQSPNKVTRNAILRTLEVNKPRNSHLVLLDYSGRATWCITYEVAYCGCESFFHNTNLEDQTSSCSSKQDSSKVLEYLTSPYDNGLDQTSSCFSKRKQDSSKILEYLTSPYDNGLDQTSRYFSKRKQDNSKILEYISSPYDNGLVFKPKAWS